MQLSITPNPQTVVVEKYSVRGETYEDAVADAKIQFAKMFPDEAIKCDDGCTGLTDSGLNNGVKWSFSSHTDRKSGKKIGVLILSYAKDATKMYLPDWTGPGAAKASEGDRQKWRDYASSLKDHEDGHEIIGSQEYIKIKQSLASTPMRYSTTLKGGTSSEVEAQLKTWAMPIVNRVNAVLTPAFQAFRDRDKRYDDLTRHGTIKKSEVKEW